MCGLKFSKNRRKKKADPNQLSERNCVKMVQTLSMVVCFILSATSSLLVPRTECWCPCPVLSEKKTFFFVVVGTFISMVRRGWGQEGAWFYENAFRFVFLFIY